MFKSTKLKIAKSTTTKRSLLLLSALALILPSATMASSVSFYDVFALQNGGSSKVFLLGNPGATLKPTGKGHGIEFGVKLKGIVPKGGDTLVITAVVMGSTLTQTVTFASGTYPPGNSYIALFGFNMPKGGYKGTPVQMTMQLFGANGKLLQSSNANFNYTAPVPEPASLGLMGIGLVGLSWTMMRKYGKGLGDPAQG